MSQILLDKKSSDSVGELSALTRTTAAYRRNAWLAVGGLVLFIVLYLSLAGWFTWTAYRIFFLLPAEKYADFWTITAGCLAAFMAFFMIKALFFIKRADASGRVEITQKDQPKLFAFLNEIADAAQAPRPRKVYVSPRVNACVFYDLSLLSFIFPSKKNLEIGLGLVNALSMGEFKSVLAHEFGHFAQRSAAVGRWVYIAQQIAAHLVARRDGLDHFLRSLAWSDPRVAWLAWILNLFIWTIRALIDTAFMLLIAAQRALSREMEFNADLVAVSQTGSDALINALHCLQGADDAWERALAFAQAEKQQGRLVRDIFVLQSHISRCLGVIRDDPHFGRSHIIPEEEPHLYRIFRAGVGQPPRMWLTHPLNHEREANAKRTYIRAEIDALNAWDIFQDAAILRERLTAEALSPIPDGAAVVLSEESIATLDKQFGREHLSARYHGVYYGRAFTCYAATTSELYANALELQGGSSADFYPESLKSDVETLRYLEAELMQLRGVIGGFLTFQPEAGGPMDKRLQNQELKSLLTQKEAEKNKVEARIQQHDRFVRGWCLRQAETIGLGWPDYLKGLLAIVHYAEHSDANIQDAREHLRHTLRVETATRKVNNAGRKRILLSANDLHDALKSLFANSASGTLDSSLQVAIGKETLSAMFGEFGLRSATPDNIVDWLNNVDGWTNHALGICDTLRRNALDLLLKKEAELNQNVSDGTPIELASPASHAPAHFERLVPGQERKKAEKLHWWARFQLADGRLAGGARLATALGMMLGSSQKTENKAR